MTDPCRENVPPHAYLLAWTCKYICLTQQPEIDQPISAPKHRPSYSEYGSAVRYMTGTYVHNEFPLRSYNVQPPTAAMAPSLLLLQRAIKSDSYIFFTGSAVEELCSCIQSNDSNGEGGAALANRESGLSLVTTYRWPIVQSSRQGLVNYDIRCTMYRDDRTYYPMADYLWVRDRDSETASQEIPMSLGIICMGLYPKHGTLYGVHCDCNAVLLRNKPRCNGAASSRVDQH
ncbi:hypothetical protein ACRALDRAFT_205364 [Sodiomyces alcalophilus JCM 7366]|uniref:uncharacterized protein n=1 Tax=Sodiomyces alcalophilus JCM 7366 TaxID=591952 RepID=UPI0039B676A0